MEPVLPDPAAAGYEASSRYRAPQNFRLLSALLSLAVVALMVLVLVTMGFVSNLAKVRGTLLTAMNLTPPPAAKGPTPTVAKTSAKSANHSQAQAAPIPPPPHVEVNNPNKDPWPEGFVHTSHAEMAAADIGKIHSSVGNGKANAGGGGAGGEGAGGSSFYNVDWYRKPPRTVFENYMRPGQSTGRRAEIECRMIENYHVEDCHELSEEPRGTGMARVMREAAWQFLVRPPRLNGKSLLGTRVRITYTFTKADGDDGPAQTGESP